MLYCPYCKVSVAGEKDDCPLCGGKLTGNAEPDAEVFPPIQQHRVRKSFVLRLLACLAFVASAVCALVNIAYHDNGWWSLFVVAGSVSFCVSAAVGIAYRRDIIQNIAWQILLTALLSILWDIGTGWHNWSLDFVLPCVCAAGLAAMLLLSLLLHIPLNSITGPYLSTCILGLVPLILVVLGKVQIPLPSLICAGASIISLIVLALFGWQTFKAEFQRRFHV